MFAFHNGSDFLRVPNGDIYTYPTMQEALTDFKCVSKLWNVYQVELDLSEAELVDVEVEKKLVGPRPADQYIELTDDQKDSMFRSFVYKSLLCWEPEVETVT